MGLEGTGGEERESVVFFFLMVRRPPGSPLFPDTTLFRSDLAALTAPRSGSTVEW